MLTSNQKEFIDTLARAIALESLDQTGKGDYYDMMEYIIHEASYEDIVLNVFDKKTLHEQAGTYDGQYLDTDIERARRLSQIEKLLKPIIGTGAAFLASGSVDKKLIEPAAKALGGAKGGMMSGFVRGMGGMLAFSAISAAAGILVKFLMVTIEKTKSVCRVTCKKKFNPQQPNYRLLVNGCAAECKLQGLTNTVAYLRGQVAQCNNTPNPEKCQTNLVKIIGKYNDMIAEERGKLKSYAAQLKQKTSIERQTGGVKPPQANQGA